MMKNLRSLPPLRSRFTVILCTIAALTMTTNLFAAPQKDNRAAAIVDNQVITYQQIIDPIADKLYDAERKLYDLKYGQLRSELLQRFVAKHPLSQGMSPDQFVQTHIIKNPSASDSEVAQFIVDKQIPADKIHSVSLGAFRMPASFFKKMEKLHPEEKLFAGQLVNHNGTIGYKIEIEEQRKETCKDLLLKHIGKETKSL